jgi:hypothetical protein
MKEIKDKARFVLAEKEFKILELYLINNNINSCRIFIENIISLKEQILETCNEEEKPVIMDELLVLTEVENSIFNLYMMNDEDDEEQIRKNIK